MWLQLDAFSAFFPPGDQSKCSSNVKWYISCQILVFAPMGTCYSVIPNKCLPYGPPDIYQLFVIDLIMYRIKSHTQVRPLVSQSNDHAVTYDSSDRTPPSLMSVGRLSYYMFHGFVRATSTKSRHKILQEIWLQMYRRTRRHSRDPSNASLKSSSNVDTQMS